MRSIQRLLRIALAPWRPAVAALSIGCLLLGTLGFPVARRKVAEGDAPFPCQDHACGCTSAEACWKSCCCFTPQEKLAWAERRGIAPPEYAISQAATSNRKDACCATGKAQGCGSHAPAELAANCSDKSCHEHGPATAEPQGVMIELAIGELARHCQGLSPWWGVLSAALPPACVEFNLSCEPVGWLRVGSASADSIFSLPAVPPPRARELSRAFCCA